MEIKMLSLVTATLMVVGTIVAVATLAIAAPVYAQGNDWCYTRGFFATPGSAYAVEQEFCFSNRGDCNTAQGNDELASSGCYKNRP